MIWWDQPGYVVAFTTRVGGVSEGVYESLNLTARTGDDAERVEENRRRACAEVGLPLRQALIQPPGSRGGGSPGGRSRNAG